MFFGATNDLLKGAVSKKIEFKAYIKTKKNCTKDFLPLEDSILHIDNVGFGLNNTTSGDNKICQLKKFEKLTKMTMTTAAIK